MRKMWRYKHTTQLPGAQEKKQGQSIEASGLRWHVKTAGVGGCVCDGHTARGGLTLRGCWRVPERGIAVAWSFMRRLCDRQTHAIHSKTPSRCHRQRKSADIYQAPTKCQSKVLTGQPLFHFFFFSFFCKKTFFPALVGYQ